MNLSIIFEGDPTFYQVINRSETDERYNAIKDKI